MANTQSTDNVLPDSTEHITPELIDKLEQGLADVLKSVTDVRRRVLIVRELVLRDFHNGETIHRYTITKELDTILGMLT
jgi:hypothetical protein